MLYNLIWVVVMDAYIYQMSSSSILQICKLYCVIVISHGGNENDSQPWDEVGEPVLCPLQALPKKLLLDHRE